MVYIGFAYAELKNEVNVYFYLWKICQTYKFDFAFDFECNFPECPHPSQAYLSQAESILCKAWLASNSIGASLAQVRALADLLQACSAERCSLLTSTAPLVVAQVKLC